MLRILEKVSLTSLFLAFSVSFCSAGTVFDKNRHISVDEIVPGMEAYCLTIYEGTEIEKFDLEVISVVKGMTPGHDAIIVRGLDERFFHTGPVAGCSGSPVYIDNRIAGALAFGWPYSKDALYGVTPIQEMLEVGEGIQTSQARGSIGFSIDYTAPIDLTAVYSKLDNPLLASQNSFGTATALPSPLIISGIPGESTKYLESFAQPFGLMPVAGLGGTSSSLANTEVSLVPGATLAVPLVSGDIQMTAVGTVTEVIGDQVYGFGHSFLGYGAIDLPMATGQIHTVVASMVRSFKLGTALETVGAFEVDESAAIKGRLGAKAKMIPLNISVARYNDTHKRVYNCQIANNRLLTPGLLSAGVNGASQVLGGFPPDHLVRYKGSIGIQGYEPIVFENVSQGRGTSEMIAEGIGSVMMLMNNPYQRINIESLDFDFEIENRSISSHIWSVDISDTQVKAGQRIKISTVIESVLADKKKYECILDIPEDLAPGKYNLMVMGGQGYRAFIRQAMIHKFIPQNLPTLIQGLKDSLATQRDQLYCILSLPNGGVTLEGAELPDLPPTKALVLSDSRRTLKTSPYQHWIEKKFDTGTIVIDKKVISILVQE